MTTNTMYYKILVRVVGRRHVPQISPRMLSTTFLVIVISRSLYQYLYSLADVYQPSNFQSLDKYLYSPTCTERLGHDSFIELQAIPL